MADHLYVGKAKFKELQNGTIWNISITPQGREIIASAENASATGWCNLKMVAMRQQDGQGNTHTLYVDDYKPSGGGGQQTQYRGQPPQGRSAPPPRLSRPVDDGGFGTPQSTPADADNFDDIPF